MSVLVGGWNSNYPHVLQEMMSVCFILYVRYDPTPFLASILRLAGQIS